MRMGFFLPSFLMLYIGNILNGIDHDWYRGLLRVLIHYIILCRVLYMPDLGLSVYEGFDKEGIVASKWLGRSVVRLVLCLRYGSLIVDHTHSIYI